MLRGFYAAASGMIAQQRQIDMNSNNLANANTPGFKAVQSSLRAFPEMLLSRIGGQEDGKPNSMVHSSLVGPLNTGVYMQEAAPLMKQGDLRDTGNMTDVAIVNGSMPEDVGTILYQVRFSDEDVAYTRNGNFSIDGNGYLTTSQGNFVLNTDGDPIVVPGDSFEVGEDGALRVNGLPLGQLGIAFSENPNGLKKVGNGLYTSENPLPLATEVDGVQFALKQGSLEASNVDLQQTMTNMMNSYRLFEMNQKVLKAFDESLAKTVSEIGRV